MPKIAPITYTPNVVARNVKRLDNDVIEVKRYNDNSLRELFLAWFIVFLGFWIHIVFIEKDSILYREMEWARNAEAKGANILSMIIDYKNPEFTNLGKPIAEYKKNLLNELSIIKLEPISN